MGRVRGLKKSNKGPKAKKIRYDEKALLTYQIMQDFMRRHNEWNERSEQLLGEFLDGLMD